MQEQIDSPIRVGIIERALKKLDAQKQLNNLSPMGNIGRSMLL